MKSDPHRKHNAPPDNKSAKAGAGRRSKPEPARSQALEALILELKALRSVLKESVSQFELKHSARIAAMIRLLEGDPATGEKPLAPKGKQRDALLARLSQSKFKPKKGRLKDLVALHAVIDLLEESLGSLSDKDEV